MGEDEGSRDPLRGVKVRDTFQWDGGRAARKRAKEKRRAANRAAFQAAQSAYRDNRWIDQQGELVRRQERDHCVYFILAEATKMVKIGTTSDLAKRMAALKTASAVPLQIVYVCDGDEVVERWFHDRFAEYRTTGEWFQLRGRLERFVEMVRGRELGRADLDFIAMLATTGANAGELKSALAALEGASNGCRRSLNGS